MSNNAAADLRNLMVTPGRHLRVARLVLDSQPGSSGPVNQYIRLGTAYSMSKSRLERPGNMVVFLSLKSCAYSPSHGLGEAIPTRRDAPTLVLPHAQTSPLDSSTRSAICSQPCLPITKNRVPHTS